MAPKSRPEIEIARISFKQAVIVAVITTLGGILGGYLIKGSSSADASPPKQHWLIIHGVSGLDGANLKLIARVNNIAYSYPADVITTVLRPNMPEQKCPLPITDRYTVAFEAYFWQDSEQKRNARNRETPSFSLAQLPIERQTYGLHEVINGSKDTYNILTVTYSIRAL